MPILNFLKPENLLEEGGRAAIPAEADAGGPELSCPNCHRDIPLEKLNANALVCSCGHHFRMGARERIEFITDRNSFKELFWEVKSCNPLEFPGYDEKAERARDDSGEDEAVICGTASVGGQKCCLFAMEARFMMGSMGSAVGEKITLLFEHALKRRLPVVGFIVSGGARMQEGLLSLMQMAKTSAAVKRHSDAGLLYLAVLTNPTTGGVTASFAMQADIILAEPGATIGFAGKRVIEQTINQKLPKEFQSAEFVLSHGFVDRIAPRSEQKRLVAGLLKFHNGGAMWSERHTTE